MPAPPDTPKKSFKQRLGLSSGTSSSGRRLTKKSLRKPEESFSGYDYEAPVVLEEWERKPEVDLDVAPEDRYRQAQLKRLTRDIPPPSPREGAEVPVVQASQVARHADGHKGVIDKDTGERLDLTEMMHALHYDVDDEGPEIIEDEVIGLDPSRPRGEQDLAKLSAEIWIEITSYLRPQDAANLAMTCKTVLFLVGSQPFDNLRRPMNKKQRIDFLLAMDEKLPGQLFCFPCAAYHIRTHPGQETLKPTSVLNPLYICPNRTNTLIPPPRHRIAPGRTIPFSFVQLVTRAQRYGPEYGLPADDLARRWSDPWSAWTHHTRFHVLKNGHLMMRVVSQVFAEPKMTLAAKRLLLYSRDDYVPYFSVCAHWRDGLLMDICKCALNHIPGSKQRSAYLGGVAGPPPSLPKSCADCKPMRRCPQCPTEYLVEVKLVENVHVEAGRHGRFKQALVVTRWTDLGDGVSTDGPEWSAIQGDSDEFSSFDVAGNRSLAATFESAFGDHYPGSRLLSLNPRGLREGEEGNRWY